MLALLRKHRDNLAELELQRSQYGASVPLEIINGIKAEQEEIERIEQRIADLAEIEEYIAANERKPDIVTPDSNGSALRSIETKIDNLRVDVHRIDTQQQLLRAQFDQQTQRMSEKFAELDKRLGTDPFLSIPRGWIAGGALVMLAVLFLLIVVTWRLF